MECFGLDPVASTHEQSYPLYTLASATPTLATEMLDPSRGWKDLVYIEVEGRVIADHYK